MSQREIPRSARDDSIDLVEESDRKGIPIQFSFTRFHRSDDHEHDVQNPERDQNRDADQNKAEHECDRVINQHRDLEIERFLSVRVDFARIAAFDQPNNQRAEKEPQHVEK